MQVPIRNVHSPRSDGLCRKLCFSWSFRVSSLSFAPVQWYCSWSPRLCPASGLPELLFPSSFGWFLVFYSGISFDVPQRIISCPSSMQCFLSKSSWSSLSFPRRCFTRTLHCSLYCLLSSPPTWALWGRAPLALYSDSEDAGPTPVLGNLHEFNKSNEWINFKDWRFTCQIILNFFLFISLASSFCGNEFSSPKLGYVFRISICFYGLFFIFNSLTHLKFIVEYKWYEVQSKHSFCFKLHLLCIESFLIVICG